MVLRCGNPSPMLDLPSGLSPSDLVAVAIHLGAWAVMGYLIEHPPAGRTSVANAMKTYRRSWMIQFTSRKPRIFDSQILNMLQQSASFFASACMIAIGGSLALIGNPEVVANVAEDVSIAPISALVWRIKIMLVLILVINAFLKFVWSMRLFGYCAILMASVPNDTDDPITIPRALKAAEVNINAARNFNSGLRSVYFAIGGLGWLLGPWMLTAATVMVSWSTWRREFRSASRRAILRPDLPSHD